MSRTPSFSKERQLLHYESFVLDAALMRKEIGRLIQQARTAKGFKQSALAIQLGHKTHSMLANVERGVEVLSLDMAQKLEKELGLAPHSILSLVLKYRLEQATAMVIEEGRQRGLNLKVRMSFQ